MKIAVDLDSSQVFHFTCINKTSMVGLMNTNNAGYYRRLQIFPLIMGYNTRNLSFFIFLLRKFHPFQFIWYQFVVFHFPTFSLQIKAVMILTDSLKFSKYILASKLHVNTYISRKSKKKCCMSLWLSYHLRTAIAKDFYGLMHHRPNLRYWLVMHNSRKKELFSTIASYRLK